MKTKITQEGWHIIEGDLISGWVEEQKDLMHDKFLPVLACSNIPVGATVIDVGANIGTHSVAYARKVGAEGNVLALEPGKIAFECLAENAKKFESKIYCFNVAACDVHGGTAIHSVNQTNVGGSTVNETANGEVFSNEVRTVTIDGLVESAQLDRLDFMKIDVEGCEMKVLRGAINTLNRFKPKMLIEMNSFRLLEHGSSYKELYDWLLSKNYSWQICQPELKGGDAQYDILCWPNLVEVAKTLPNG